MKRITVRWVLTSPGPDYTSECGRFIAVYKDSYGGYGNYWVFERATKKQQQTRKNALAFGGLPETLTVPS